MKDNETSKKIAQWNKLQNIYTEIHDAILQENWQLVIKLGDIKTKNLHVFFEGLEFKKLDDDLISRVRKLHTQEQDLVEIIQQHQNKLKQSFVNIKKGKEMQKAYKNTKDRG